MEKIRDTHTTFSHRFAMLHRLQMSMCRDDIKQAGLQPSQFPFLAILAQGKSQVTQDYLSRSLAIDKGTTARAISQLKKAGLVVRMPNPENRRQKLVSVTKKGHCLAEGLFKCFKNATEVFVQGFTAEERDIILNLMDRMISNAESELNGRNI